MLHEHSMACYRPEKKKKLKLNLSVSFLYTLLKISCYIAPIVYSQSCWDAYIAHYKEAGPRASGPCSVQLCNQNSKVFREMCQFDYI